MPTSVPKKNAKIICKKPVIRNSPMSVRILKELVLYDLAKFDGEYYTVNWKEVVQIDFSSGRNIGPKSIELMEQWAESVLGEGAVVKRPPTIEEWTQQRLAERKEIDQEADEALEKTLIKKLTRTYKAKEHIRAYRHAKSFLQKQPGAMTQVAGWMPLELLRALTSCPHPKVTFNVRIEGNALSVLSNRKAMQGTEGRTWHTRVLSSALAFRDLCSEVPGGRGFYEQGICAIHQLNCVKWDEDLERPWRII